MADTIITNTPGVTRGDDGAGALGWVVALIIIVALVVGGVVWARHGFRVGSGRGTTNINVTVPGTGGGSTGGATGAGGTGY